MARIDNLYIVTERPYYRSGGAKFYLDARDELGANAPKVGDAVRIDEPYTDADGDYEMRNGAAISADVVVSVERIVSAYRAAQDTTTPEEPLADWERELLGVEDKPKAKPKVSGDARALSVSAVATELYERTDLDGEAIDLAIAYALLRTEGIL
ncbi:MULTISPECIES: hypothetical protein [unclassified Microbacterium]|uniref:hypothetical protein n=1 Tax=unclassified Microbacterium TaxID=2609290 RepID=UPI000412D00C|nr:hypothetical protein [Microbacterium sp. B24]